MSSERLTKYWKSEILLKYLSPKYAFPQTRKNPLTNEEILVSPQRVLRKWKGQTEARPSVELPAYDCNCSLCPGNERDSGECNPGDLPVYVFPNDAPAVYAKKKEKNHTTITRRPTDDPHGFFTAKDVYGECEVVVYSQKHNRTMATLSQEQIGHVIDAWQDRYIKLGARKDIKYVQIFENKGEMMGCSQPHPHGQIWATSYIPPELKKELKNQKQYFINNGTFMLLDYLREEMQREERILYSNDRFTVLVPYWAEWPYETIIIPNSQITSIDKIHKKEKTDLADTFSTLTQAYDKLFGVSFPYSMGIHQAPTNGKDHDYQTMHFHFYPPLLRSATVKKHKVGFEMLAGPQRDITPEMAVTGLTINEPDLQVTIPGLETCIDQVLADR